MGIAIASHAPYDHSREKHEWLLKWADEIYHIRQPKDLDFGLLKAMEMDYIFFTHWSEKIPAEIYENFHCILFHMTDLPYGRGGTPLQNLILRGHDKTKISMIKVEEGMDTGPVYMKWPLGLEGSADQIYRRASDKIFYFMIKDFLMGVLEDRPTEPVEQARLAVDRNIPREIFRRRKPKDSDITEACWDLKEHFDRIRMMDAPGYPVAYVEVGGFKYFFTKAEYFPEFKKIRAEVVICES